MKSKAKVRILVVTVVVAVGVGIGVWVHYDRVHDQETASLVDHAVSSALAGVTTQPTETTTEPAATEAYYHATAGCVLYLPRKRCYSTAHRVNDQATHTKSTKSTTKFSAIRRNW